MDVDRSTGEIVDAAVWVHTRLGPGLLESVYGSVLARELQRRGLRVERQRAVRFEVDGLVFEDGLRVDLLVEGQVVVELKSVEQLAPVHWKQTLTYIKLLNLQVGLLINFGEVLLKDGLHRVVNRYSASSASPRENRRLRRPVACRSAGSPTPDPGSCGCEQRIPRSPHPP